MNDDMTDDLALLVLRATAGGLMAGHGAQKLFGWFGGHGFQGTRGWLESMGMRPGHYWAAAASAAEFGGGVLTALGLAEPLGPIGITAAMSMATAKVHWGKPIWVTSGGAELPVTNMAIAAALMLAGPGKLSLDNLIGLKLPRWLALPGMAAVAIAILIASQAKPPEQQVSHETGSAELPANERQPQTSRDVAGGELQAGKEAAHPV